MIPNSQKLTIIHIKNLICEALIGTHERERNQTQEIILNIYFSYNAATAIYNDDLTKAIDYDCLTSEITTYIRKSEFFLLESLSDSIVELIMGDQRITHAEVSITKPKAVDLTESITVTRSESR